MLWPGETGPWLIYVVCVEVAQAVVRALEKQEVIAGKLKRVCSGLLEKKEIQRGM